MGFVIVDGRGEGGSGSFVRETAGAGVVVESGVVDLRGVLRGDLKGWDKVFAEVFSRRRLEGWMGDMIERKIGKMGRRGGGMKRVFAHQKVGLTLMTRLGFKSHFLQTT